MNNEHRILIMKADKKVIMGYLKSLNQKIESAESNIAAAKSDLKQIEKDLGEADIMLKIDLPSGKSE